MALYPIALGPLADAVRPNLSRARHQELATHLVTRSPCVASHARGTHHSHQLNTQGLNARAVRPDVRHRRSPVTPAEVVDLQPQALWFAFFFNLPKSPIRGGTGHEDL